MYFLHSFDNEFYLREECCKVKFGKLAVVLAMVGISASLCACGHSGQSSDDNKVETSELFEKIGSEKENISNESGSVISDVQTEEPTEEQDSAQTEVSVETVEVEDNSQNDASEDVATDTQPTDEVTEEEEVEIQTEVVESTVQNAPPTVNVTATYDLQTLENMHYSDEQMQQIIQYYNGSVFAGDSVLLGFRNYASRSTDPMLTQMQFLAAGSLSLHNAFWPVSEKSVHPLYQGAQHPIWESMQMMGANKAFLFFGINDVSYNIDESVALYPQLVDKIREYCPNMEINIISATYTLKDMGKGKLNNTNIAAFNQGVRALAEQNGWGYIDMATVLSDGAGNLAPDYCSDGFLHESKKAYNVWTQMLVRYAAERLGIQETPVDTTAQEAPENNG